MPPPATVEIISTTAALRAFTPQWIDLWHTDRHATPFQRPEWLLPWWHHFGQPDLRAITISEEGTLLALLPLYIYHDPTSEERQLLLLGAGTSDYLDGLFSPACTAPHLLYALDLLHQEKTWDVAHFTQLRPQSLLFQALQQRGGDDLTPYDGELCSRCPAVALAHLPAKVRSEVRYYRNYAIGRGKLEFTVAEPSQLDHVFNTLVDAHTARWQQAGESGVLAVPSVLAWHREALPDLQAAGVLRLCVLRLDGEIIAVLYSLIDLPIRPETIGSRPERTQYFYLMGFSLEHAELRPGTLLTGLAIDHAAGEGVRGIDMLRGREIYKHFWHTEPIPTYGFALRRKQA